MSSWDQANRGEKLGLVWRNRKKISQIIYYYCKDYEFFYRESLAAGSLDQLPAPLEHILADA
jgi:hypothetical protein